VREKRWRGGCYAFPVNPFEPPVQDTERKRVAPLRMRMLALGMVAVGLWHAFSALSGFHRIGWVELVFAGLCFGLAMLTWKP
jgi:hypothetical protein